MRSLAQKVQQVTGESGILALSIKDIPGQEPAQAAGQEGNCTLLRAKRKKRRYLASEPLGYRAEFLAGAIAFDDWQGIISDYRKPWLGWILSSSPF